MCAVRIHKRSNKTVKEPKPLPSVFLKPCLLLWRKTFYLQAVSYFTIMSTKKKNANMYWFYTEVSANDKQSVKKLAVPSKKSNWKDDYNLSLMNSYNKWLPQCSCDPVKLARWSSLSHLYVSIPFVITISQQ